MRKIFMTIEKITRVGKKRHVKYRRKKKKCELKKMQKFPAAKSDIKRN